jgi:hypothetical protein
MDEERSQKARTIGGNAWYCDRLAPTSRKLVGVPASRFLMSMIPTITAIQALANMGRTRSAVAILLVQYKTKIQGKVKGRACSSDAFPPTSKKLAGVPPCNLMMSMVAMARPAPFTIHPMFPSRPM